MCIFVRIFVLTCRGVQNYSVHSTFCFKIFSRSSAVAHLYSFQLFSYWHVNFFRSFLFEKSVSLLLYFEDVSHGYLQVSDILIFSLQIQIFPTFSYTRTGFINANLYLFLLMVLSHITSTFDDYLIVRKWNIFQCRIPNDMQVYFPF